MSVFLAVIIITSFVLMSGLIVGGIVLFRKRPVATDITTKTQCPAPNTTDFSMTSPAMFAPGTYTIQNVKTGNILNYSPTEGGMITTWVATPSNIFASLSPSTQPSLYLSASGSAIEINSTQTQWQIIPILIGSDFGLSLESSAGVLCDSQSYTLQPSVVDASCLWTFTPS